MRHLMASPPGVENVRDSLCAEHVQYAAHAHADSKQRRLDRKQQRMIRAAAGEGQGTGRERVGQSGQGDAPWRFAA